MVEAEEAAQSFDEGYINESDPSVLRFLIASRQIASVIFTQVCIAISPANFELTVQE
jgi:hypothetical protein